MTGSQTLLASMAEQVYLGTFHSLGARILRRHAELVKLKPNFTILDTDDQIRLIKQIMQAENLDEKSARFYLELFRDGKTGGLR